MSEVTEINPKNDSVRLIHRFPPPLLSLLRFTFHLKMQLLRIRRTTSLSVTTLATETTTKFESAWDSRAVFGLRIWWVKKRKENVRLDRLTFFFPHWILDPNTTQEFWFEDIYEELEPKKGWVGNLLLDIVNYFVLMCNLKLNLSLLSDMERKSWTNFHISTWDWGAAFKRRA